MTRRTRRMPVKAKAFVTMLLATALSPLLIAPALSGTGAPSLRECRADERQEVLRREQEAVLARLGRFTVLRNVADVRALARPPRNYEFLAHQFTSFEGLGLTITNSIDAPRLGVPNLLFYGPSENARDTTDPRGPDFPYRLVGWGYGLPYEPARVPALIPCMGTKDWHIHERGVHRIDDGGMTVMPPTETVYGESPGTFLDAPAMEPVVGFPHARSWNIHFWLEDGDVLTSAILDPRDPPPGVDAGLGSSFFFPDQQPPPIGNIAAQASAARAFVVEAGEGERAKLQQSVFTFKAGEENTGGSVAFIDVDFRRGSEPPQHIHHREVEAFYLLDGEMTFEVGGQTYAAQAGDFIFLPRGVAHVYGVEGDGTARALLVATPAGLERFFREQAGKPPDAALALKYGIEAVGPPLRARR